MRFDLANLPNTIAALHRIIASQAADFAAERKTHEGELSAAKAGLVAQALEIEKLKLQIARLRRAQFGRSSEKIERTIEQLELRLEELETDLPGAAVAVEASAPDVEQSSSTKSKRSGRKPLPEHLPRREVVHEPSCTCPTCGGEMRKVGEDLTEILDYIPDRFEVAVRGRKRCRIHGGLSPGAPRGRKNGNFKNGDWTTVTESVKPTRLLHFPRFVWGAWAMLAVQ